MSLIPIDVNFNNIEYNENTLGCFSFHHTRPLFPKDGDCYNNPSDGITYMFINKFWHVFGEFHAS